MSDSMKLSVDPDKCQGHNRCYALAPELFDVDDLGFATAAGDGIVPDELMDKAQRAVSNCPEYAITLSPVSESASPASSPAGGEQ